MCVLMPLNKLGQQDLKSVFFFFCLLEWLSYAEGNDSFAGYLC